MRRAAFPGSFNPPTVAHLDIADAARRQCGVDRVDLVLSRVAINKETVERPTVDERADVLHAVAANGRPWLGVVVTDDRLLVDIADGYDVLVLGADKWAQVIDARYYGDDDAARDHAVARLPHLAFAPRVDTSAPPGATVLDVAHHDVSSTRAREGLRGLMLPEALSSGLW
ncbi:MAG TPA: hypothetical protein VEA78_10360 [Acidimicrobiales bacterium]|nr:hypothetical protein [Acidimicrobiales bacterium]